MSVSKLIKDDKKPVEINLALWVILYLPRLFFLEVIFKELKRAHTQKEKKITTAKTPKINQHCYLSSLRESISGGITEIGKNYKTDEGFISLKSSPLFVSLFCTEHPSVHLLRACTIIHASSSAHSPHPFFPWEELNTLVPPKNNLFFLTRPFMQLAGEAIAKKKE